MVGDTIKQVSIMQQYLDYLVPEVASAFEVIWGYHSEGMQPFQPSAWVAWFEDTDPCGIPFDYRSWPEGMPDIRAYLHADLSPIYLCHEQGMGWGQVTFQE